MTLFRTVEPAVEPVTLVQAKAYLRIDQDAEDDLLASLIRAARMEVEQQTGVALIEQSWRLALDGWPVDGVLQLRRHPVRELLSVTVYGTEGEASIVDPAVVEADLASRPARVLVTQRVPPERRLNGVEVDFTAGFGETGVDVPEPLKRAVLALVAHWYEFRAAYTAADQPVSLPAGFDRMIAPWRSGRL